MRSLPNRPASRFARLAAAATAALCALALGSCLSGAVAPEGLRGLGGDAGEVWLALPMEAWLGTVEGAGEPETIVACLGAGCPARLAAGVFRLAGENARRAERDLRDPQALVAGLDAARRARGSEAPPVAVTAAPFSHGELGGFVLTLSGEGERPRALHAAALGRREGAALRVALAIADDALVARAAVIQIVDGALGPAPVSSRP